MIHIHLNYPGWHELWILEVWKWSHAHFQSSAHEICNTRDIIIFLLYLGIFGHWCDWVLGGFCNIFTGTVISWKVGGPLWSPGASINPLSPSIICDHLSYAWLHGCRALLPHTVQWLTLSSNKKVLGSRASQRLHVLRGSSPGIWASSKSPKSLWCPQFHIMLWIQLIQLLCQVFWGYMHCPFRNL